MNETLTQQELQVLRKEFPADRLSVKVQAWSKDRTRAMLVAYIQHTDVQDRLDEVDPAWRCEAIEQKEIKDVVYVRMRMTVKGVSRENVGEGEHPKAAFSDAIKRCAMLFGVGRYLYDGERKWVPYDEQRDKYREWSIDEYFGNQQAAGQQAEVRQLPPRVRPAPDLGEYIVRFGRKFMGWKLKELEPADLESYVDYLRESSEESGVPISPAADEFIHKVSEYLTAVRAKGA